MKNLIRTKLLCGIALASGVFFPAISQQLESGQIEEIVVMAKLRTAAGDIIAERIERESMTDIIGAEQIGRIGDSNVATALRRVPGVTLVDDKFIYVRGLGERYSSSLLNGAQVPSPDLTRNVLPLDIFPTSIVNSIAVQKSYSTDMPAGFGGGNVNIRTHGIPNGPTFSIEIGTSYNTQSTGDALAYEGGSDDWLGSDDGTRALPKEISTALTTYGGSINPFDIGDTIYQAGGINFADAVLEGQAINRQLATSLNRDVDISEESAPFNGSFQLEAGNSYFLPNDWEVGFLLGASYSNETVNSEVFTTDIADPAEQPDFKNQTTRSIDLTGNLALGLRPNDDNEVTLTSMYIRNTDDDVAIVDYFDDNRPLSGGSGFRNYELSFEERQLRVNQLSGSHFWSAETKRMLFLDENALAILDEAEFTWYLSNSKATTDIPGEAGIEFQTVTDPITGAVSSASVSRSESMLRLRYTDLDDDVDSYGWALSVPYYFSDATLQLSGGYDYARKSRTYRQTDVQLGSTDADIVALTGLPVSDLFSDANLLDEDLGFAVNVTTATARSYLAATTNESVFGKVDLNWADRWRFITGVRWEQYAQVGLPWSPLSYNQQITSDADELERAVFMDDAFYPSVSLIYMVPDFWAQEFQLRFNASQTVVRPDLREITETSYQDPINSEFLIFGNQDVIPSDVLNLDFRAEWFFSNGDNFTLTAFYKEIDNPIEFFERPASDRKRAAQIQNAESARVQGVEAEWLHDLSYWGPSFSPFFVAGNLTLAESKLETGVLPTPPTNESRPLSGASEYVANLQLGFDSDSGMHSATLVYNVFGERVFAAGINGSPDSYEQPFNSLDLTYSFYPTDRTTLKLKLKNLLDENSVVEQGDITVYEQQVGMSASLDFEWQL